jgi:hypothetical protein
MRMGATMGDTSDDTIWTLTAVLGVELFEPVVIRDGHDQADQIHTLYMDIAHAVTGAPPGTAWPLEMLADVTHKRIRELLELERRTVEAEAAQ